MGVLGNIAGQGFVSFEIRGQLFDGLFLAVALIGQDELGAFAGKGLGDSVSQAPLICHAEDERRLPASSWAMSYLL